MIWYFYYEQKMKSQITLPKGKSTQSSLSSFKLLQQLRFHEDNDDHRVSRSKKTKTTRSNLSNYRQEQVDFLPLCNSFFTFL